MSPLPDYTLPLEQLPDPLPIVPLEKPFDVTIRPPGSKSITNRAYVLAALAEGESRILRPLRSEDTDGLLKALCRLGAEARWEANADDPGSEDVLIKGVAGRFPRGGLVNLGDGGTPTRFMIAAACLAAEPVVVDGSPRMRERPIAEGVAMLRQLGAKIEYVEEDGRLPVRIVPSEEFKGGELTIGRTASSQFLSAGMLVAHWLERGVVIRYADGLTSATYVIMTFKIMDNWHICTECSIRDDEGWLRMHSGDVPTRSGRVQGVTFAVEPDASSAAYWLTAAAIVTHARVSIPGLPAAYNPVAESYQPDLQIVAALEAMGVPRISSGDDGDFKEWKWGATSRLRGTTHDASDMPDAALSLSIACALADGPSTITGLHTLRVKETDRIAALQKELRKVGCGVETTDDSITITPPPPEVKAAEPAEPVVIETYNDHRMAMSFAVLGLVRPGIVIANPKCVAKSYPGFWRDFAKLYGSPASP